MIVEFNLLGSKQVHRGIFDTAGFWARLEEHRELKDTGVKLSTDGWKIYSHFSFAFFHVDREIVLSVYNELLKVVAGRVGGSIINGIGYICDVKHSFKFDDHSIYSA